MATRASLYLLGRARVVSPGKCVICGCVESFACPEGCGWEPGTDRRLCTAHTEVEKDQARVALAEADKRAFRA